MKPEITRAKLANGLRIVVASCPGVHSSMLELLTRVGSRFDPEPLAGISHFLEHMLYRGTPSLPGPYELALALESKGGALDAATYVDHGTLALSVPPENLFASFDTFAEVFRSPIFEGMELERGIVREEILELLDDDGRLTDADEVIRRLAFAPHSLGRPITGLLEQLECFNTDLLREHHQRCYVAAGTVLAVAGPVDAQRVLDTAQRLFGDLPTGEAPVLTPPGPFAGPCFEFVKDVDSQTAVRLSFRAPGQSSPLQAATELVARVLDDGMSTRLYQRICNTLGLCYDVGAFYEVWQDAGVLEISGECAHPRANELVDELLTLAERLRHEGPTEAEVERAKSRVRWQLLELWDDASELGEYLGYAELAGTATDPAARWAEFEALGVADVRQAAHELFAPEGLAVACIGRMTQRERQRAEARVTRYR